MNSAATESVLGITSVRKFTTFVTSNSKRFSTSPEWRLSLPCHCDRKMRSSMCCCMRFCALMPRMFLIQMLEMCKAKSARMSAAMMPTAT